MLRVLRRYGLGLAAMLLAWPSLVSAHPGRTNAQGCHNNRRTGEYHCHGGYDSGGSDGGGGGISPPPTPICRDVEVTVVSVSLQRLNGSAQPVLWKQQSGVSVSMGNATLSGTPGKLYRYSVEGLEIRNFIVDQPAASRFSFAGGAWIPAREVRRQGDTTISILEFNPLNVYSEQYRTTAETRQECS